MIQIPRLTHKRRNELETLLSVFDQSTKIDANHHILNIKEEDFPEKHQMIIRRLQKAVLVPDLQKKMDLEDGIIDELDDMQRNIEELQEQNEFERLKTLAEKQRAEQEKQRAEQEKQRAEQEKQRAEQERQRAEIAEKELAQLKRELKKHK